MTTKKTTRPEKLRLAALPPGVRASDTKYPPYREGVRIVEILEFYNVRAFGWCIATLHIRNPGRRAPGNATPRTYAVRIDDGALVRIGIGPHVLDRVTVYVTNERLDALQTYVDLHREGESKANETRDRISTRRAQGVLRRAHIPGWMS